MIVSMGGDSGLYVFGTLGFLKALNKVGVRDVSYRCCGFSCIPLVLSLVYSNNRAYNMLVRREPLLRKIFGWAYQDGAHLRTAVDVLKVMASVEIKKIPLFNRDRVPSLIEGMFPDIGISDVGDLEIGVLDVGSGEEKMLKGAFSLRKALISTLRFTPTPEPFEGKYVSCVGSVGFPEGDVVLDLEMEREVLIPKRAIESIILAFQARREKVKKIRFEKAKASVRLKFKYFPKDLEVYNEVYRNSLRLLSQSV